MPLYDCMLMLKPHVRKEALMDLVARVGKHVYSRNGVVTDIKSFGTVQLGYGIKKLDGRHYQTKVKETSENLTETLYAVSGNTELWAPINHGCVNIYEWFEISSLSQLPTLPSRDLSS
ncbi:hypothetical protein D5086_032327 [Populus alba]|uniref:Uncharacterized protein n=1 Tax=Populus alba TaxID=43335 RepID=A0ACC4AL17_POPAL